MTNNLIKKAVLAEMYYTRKYPERNYDRDAARKQFQQDNDLDEKILLAILKESFKEKKLIDFVKSLLKVKA